MDYYFAHANCPQEYGISIKGREIVPENFSSLGKIQALVKKYGVNDEV